MYMKINRSIKYLVFFKFRIIKQETVSVIGHILIIDRKPDFKDFVYPEKIIKKQSKNKKIV